MAAIYLRSPRYRDSVCTATHLSVQMTIYISGTLRYTLTKDSEANQKNLFEYAELCRDYVDITWTGSYSGYSPITNLSIRTYIKYYAGLLGTGAEVTAGVSGGGQVDEYGVDGYSNFMDGSNKDIANDETLFSNYTQTTAGAKTYTVYAPENIGGTLPYLNSTGTETIYESYSTSATSKTLGNGQAVGIERFSCNKFDVVYIDFVNKWGAIQREYFTLKSVTKIGAKREDYQSNIIGSTGAYSINEHTIQNFNITANETLTVNSDYVPEFYNQVYTELLLSDYVWAYIKPFSTNTFTAVPVNITNSDLTYKTQVSDRLINYTFSFKMSYDYINNVR
jgi:hypothetical protein